MKTRICYQEGVSKGQPMPLTKEKWDELIDSPEVKNICQRIAKSQTDDRRQDSKLKGLENNAHIRSFQEFAEILQGKGERQHLVSIFCKCI